MSNLIIDTSFNFHSDAKGGDPDSKSPTLRRYHRLLWNKPLPNGSKFELVESKSGVYLYHKTEVDEFFMGSDAITHSYKKHKRKQWLITQILDEAEELFNAGSSIGSYIIFPNNSIDRNNSINQARGVNSLIDDRFDLTLECIRLMYLGQTSPLYDTLIRYKSFFNLFVDFIGYVRFFLLDDLIDENQKVKFYLPFDNFNTRPKFTSTADYIIYKKGVLEFIAGRKLRIEEFAKELNY
jgi:hypothetical protein